jgi:hypothetical protein
LNLFPTLEMVLFVHFAIVHNCNLLSIFGYSKLFIWTNLKLYSLNIIGYISSALFGAPFFQEWWETLLLLCKGGERERERSLVEEKWELEHCFNLLHTMLLLRDIATCNKWAYHHFSFLLKTSIHFVHVLHCWVFCGLSLVIK